MKTCLKCHCGQRIVRRDVMQRGLYMHQFGPSYVYIKYRCSRCKKLGEHFVKQEEWEDGLLHEINSELSDTEKTAFKSMGRISLEEMRSFHHALENLNGLPKTLKEEAE